MKQLFAGLVLLCSIGLFVPHSVYAQASDQNNTQTLVPKDQTINGDYFVAGNTVEIDGTVNGDVYTAANQVIINGTVNGDVIAAASSLIIGGTVAHNVRIAGKDIAIQGKVGGNVTTLGQTVTVANTSTVSGSLVGAAQQIVVNAPIPKTLTAAASELVINAPVGGNVNVRVGRLTITDKGSIKGNLTYNTTAAEQIDPAATVSGTINKVAPPAGASPADRAQIREDFARFISGIISYFIIANGIAQLVIGLILLALMPWLFERMTGNIQERTGPTVLTGLGVLFLVPILLLAIFITIIGIPLALFGFTLYGISLYLAALPVSVWLGSIIARAAKWQLSPMATFAVGLIALIILQLIPFISGLVRFVIPILGMGAIYYTLFAKQPPAATQSKKS